MKALKDADGFAPVLDHKSRSEAVKQIQLLTPKYNKKRGDSIAIKIRQLKENITALGKGVPETMLCNVARTVFDDCAKDMEGDMNWHQSESLELVLSALQSKFKCDMQKLQRELKNTVQHEHDSGVKLVDRIKQVYKNNYAEYPAGLEAMLLLANNFKSPYRVYIEQKLGLAAARNHPITLSQLEEFAKEYDSIYTERVHVTRGNAQGGRRPSVNAADGEPADDSGSYTSGGRGGSRYGHGGRFSRGRSNRGRGASSFGAMDFGASPAEVEMAEVNADVDLGGVSNLLTTFNNMAQNDTASLNMSNVKAPGRKPRKPDPVVGQEVAGTGADVDTSMKQLHTALRKHGVMDPDMQLGVAYGRMGSAVVSMQLMQLSSLVTDTKAQEACGVLNGMFQTLASESTSVHAVDVLSSSATCPVDTSDDATCSGASHTPAHGNDGKAPPAQHSQLAAKGSASSHKGAVSAPYKGALAAQPSVRVRVDHANMPQVEGYISRKPTAEGVRPFRLDSGASLNYMSQAALARDAAVLTGSGAKITTLTKTLPVKMYNGGLSHSNQLVVDAPVILGGARYLVTFVVVPEAGYDYLLGSPFIAKYDAFPRYRVRKLYIGIPPEAWLGNKSKYAPYQSVPMAFTAKQVVFACVA